MSDIAICVENLSKQYRIGAAQKSKNLREALRDAFKAPFQRVGKILHSNTIDGAELYETIWALKRVSFEIRRGEVVGIIGANGAGKSTLLKIISRITEPTEGFAEMHGRMGSLLEVGTGFHSELTGRENVYLSGAILGMKKKEIRQKFDEIVSFSEVEKFIDTPVKHYSSGMYLRLAFAVAAHLEPEILIVDEVLAVGDVQFQKKCMGKMGNIANEGRTVLFVSHSLGAITGLCKRAIWIDRGEMRLDGFSQDVVTKYVSTGTQDTGCWYGDQDEKSSGQWARLKHARVFVNRNEESTVFRFDEKVKVEIAYEINKSIREPQVYIMLRDSGGNYLWASKDSDGTVMDSEVREPGIYHSTCIFPDRLLRPGRYYVAIGINGKLREDKGEERLDVLSFQISQAGYTFNTDPRLGLITPWLNWEIVRQQDNSSSEV